STGAFGPHCFGVAGHSPWSSLSERKQPSCNAVFSPDVTFILQKLLQSSGWRDVLVWALLRNGLTFWCGRGEELGGTACDRDVAHEPTGTYSRRVPASTTADRARTRRRAQKTTRLYCSGSEPQRKYTPSPS